MKEVIQTYLNLVFKTGLILVLLSALFLFTNLTTEFYETPKFIVLLLFVGLMLILLTLKFTLQNHVALTRTPLDLPLILLFAVAVTSTALSPSPYIALLGNQLKIHGSLVSLAVYILFYFLLTQSLRSERQVRWILNLCIWAGALLGVVTLLSYFGIKILPPPYLAPNFTPTGSSFSTTAILAVLLPILVSALLTSRNLILLATNSILLTIFGITIALTGTWASWVAAILGLAIPVWIFNPFKEINLNNILSRPNLLGIFASLVIIGVTILLSFIPPYNFARNFPREIQLPFTISWKVSVSAFRDSPVWGSGPSTYLFNFTTYKPVEFNNTKFWNIRFDSAFNEYLQILAQLGGIGILAFLSLTMLFLSKALVSFKQKEPFLVGLSASGITFFIILSLHTSTLPVSIIGLLVLACFWVVGLSETPYLSFASGSIKHMLLKVASYSEVSRQSLRVEALPSILLIISAALVLFASFFAGRFFIADTRHRNAINAVSQNNGILAYNELIASEKLNPWSDIYRTDLAQVNFALANAIAQAKGPTEASPAGSLTDQDKQNIQVLLQQSISEGRTATALNPRSAINWEILALLYRQIAGVAQNALLFSLDSYGRAIFNDPLNPVLRLNVGGVYYAVQNYDLAIRFFSDAINLKPDYANGFYNLSVALRDKGDLNAAIAAAERVVALVDQASPDYKVAQDYLNDIKEKASGPPEQPPAAETTGSLQKEDLPKVLDLPKPDKIATPEAIKRSPSPSPSPKP